MDIGRPPCTHHIRANLWVVGELAQFLVGHNESVIGGNEDVVWMVRRPVCGSHESVQERRGHHSQRACGGHSADSRHGRSGWVCGGPGQRRGPLLGDERIRSIGGPYQSAHSLHRNTIGYVDSVLVRIKRSSCSGGGVGGAGGGGCLWVVRSGRNVWKPKRGCWNWNSGGGSEPSAAGTAGTAGSDFFIYLADSLGTWTDESNDRKCSTCGPSRCAS